MLSAKLAFWKNANFIWNQLSVKFLVMLARTKANLMQHKKCVDLRKCAFPGASQPLKTGVKLVIFSQILFVRVAMATQIEGFASLVDVSKDTH